MNVFAKIKSNTLLKQGSLYLIVGITSALIELVLFQVLYTVFEINYAISNISAITVSTAYNFMLNGRVTFKGMRNKWWSLVKYLILFAFNTTFTTLTIGFLISLEWPSILAKITTMACVVLWNFVLYRKVIFV